ncbi:MAG: hypothetical protein OEY52_00745 [Gammaproteobacteria bacterium]|nr:hypothetical protein [Gammaproteobacteria bacterium]
MNSVLSYLLGLGPLRWMLGSAAIIIMILRPASGTEAAFEGWAVFPTLVFPSLAPILFMLLLLDAIMSRLLMISKEGTEKARLNRAMWTDLVIAGLSLLVWYSYFSHLLTG